MYFPVFQLEDRHNLTLDFNEFHALYAYKRYAIKVYSPRIQYDRTRILNSSTSVMVTPES